METFGAHSTEVPIQTQQQMSVLLTHCFNLFVHPPHSLFNWKRQSECFYFVHNGCRLCHEPAASIACKGTTKLCRPVDPMPLQYAINLCMKRLHCPFTILLLLLLNYKQSFCFVCLYICQVNSILDNNSVQSNVVQLCSCNLSHLFGYFSSSALFLISQIRLILSVTVIELLQFFLCSLQLH
jgi:hypothetical protein